MGRKREKEWRVITFSGRKNELGQHRVIHIDEYTVQGYARAGARSRLKIAALHRSRQRDNVSHEQENWRWVPVVAYTFRLPAEDDYKHSGGVQIEQWQKAAVSGVR